MQFIDAASTVLANYVPANSSTPPAALSHIVTPSQWSWLVRQRRRFGLTRAIRKVGKRLICDPQAIAEALLSNNEIAGETHRND